VNTRLAQSTGKFTTALTGFALAALSVSAFGTSPTLLAFLALLVFASAAQRGISRQR
jgi:hypothetical protein